MSGAPVTGPNGGAPAEIAPGAQTAASATTQQGQGVAPATTPGQAPAVAAGNRQPATPTQQDLNQLRASLQRDADRRIQQVQAQAAQREQALQQQLSQVAMQGMTDQQRQQYQAQQQQAYYQQLEQQNQQYQQSLAEQQARQSYTAYFTQQMGVPIAELNLGGTVDELNASGWGYIQAEMGRLRGTAPAGQQQAEPQGPPGGVPEVVTTAGTQSAGATWPELTARLKMTEEQIYRAVEVGTLPSDILPV